MAMPGRIGATPNIRAQLDRAARAGDPARPLIAESGGELQQRQAIAIALIAPASEIGRVREGGVSAVVMPGHEGALFSENRWNRWVFNLRYDWASELKRC